MRIYNFFRRDQYGRLTVIDGRIGRLNFDLVHYSIRFKRNPFFQAYKSRLFGYTQISAGKLALRWLWGEK